MHRTLPLLMLALVLLVAAGAGLAQAQSAPDQATAIQDMEEAMDAMRAHPNFKSVILDKIRAKAEARGVGNLDAKMATLGTRLDSIAAMSAADYAAQKDQLARQLLQVLEGP